jgi:CBS-domain-containing membrane protein
MSPAAEQKRFLDSLIRPQASIREAIARLDRAGTGALLLTQEDGKLAAILTDGDIRRAILRGLPLERPCSSIANHQPVVAPSDVSAAEALRVMNHSKDYVINHLPLVDGEGIATGLLLRSDLVADSGLTMSAVIMAGGFGTRLMPLTENTPKPMLPLGDRPLLELIIDRLRDAGISRVNITTHYRPERITEHFGNGHNFGVDLQYVEEDRPLGTAGALKLRRNATSRFS